MKTPSVVVMKHSDELVIHQKFIDQQKTQLVCYFVFSSNSEQLIEENMLYIYDDNKLTKIRKISIKNPNLSLKTSTEILKKEIIDIMRDVIVQ
ncbi:MAG: hypothetical protein LBC20_11110 [Planctomycetaceae bacterium]|jgi:hypothetical protein|nr:hypothetical protein [Planctomycetaceae bacterium]